MTFLTLAVALGSFSPGAATAAVPARFGLQDIQRLQQVGDPQLSPDGRWVSYTVTGCDPGTDRKVTQLWRVRWDGRDNARITHGPHSATKPRWSPDGRELTFLAPGEGEETGTQVWALGVADGHPRLLTRVRGDVQQYAWSPDGKRLALVIAPVEESNDAGAPGPMVFDRYHFKEYDGYVQHARVSRIHLFDLETRELSPLTDSSEFEESDPGWSPDGRRIAFVSNRDAEWERTDNLDVWVAEAYASSRPRRLTTFEGADNGPLAWSPDGRLIAYTQGAPPRYAQYAVQELAVVSVDDGSVVYPAPTLDRDVIQPRFARDGRSVEFLVIDSRNVYPARVPMVGGSVRRSMPGKIVVEDLSRVRGRAVVSIATDAAPAELYAWESGSTRALTNHNARVLSGLQLSSVEDIEFPGADGILVQGLLFKPPDYRVGMRYPTVLWIHGGPYSQDEHAFARTQQLLAAHGYVVLSVNYRGSSGRGRDYARAIAADWGHTDVADLIAGIDFLVAAHIADPDRLGVGGWSQGAIRTNYLIAKDQRFKAAVAGAGSGNAISMYGTDRFVHTYDNEWGAPWTDPRRWMKLSYPLFHADRIRTPTLFAGGQDDFNVPIAGSEQMYQALKSLRVPARLVIYPGERHGLSRVSFSQDLLARTLEWFEQYLR